MKRMRYWFAKKKLLMAQMPALQRQLQEAWNEKGTLEDYYMDEWDKNNNLTDQLHRVARERDQERKKRIDAEVALLDKYLDKDDLLPEDPFDDAEDGMESRILLDE